MFSISDKDFQSRTPDSPESTRAVAPRSPISPKGHYNNLTLQRNSNGSLSPIQKGSSTTPPLASSAASTPNASTPILLSDTSRELSKLRKFLGALYQFGQDTSTECGDRVRSLILSLVVRNTLFSFDILKEIKTWIIKAIITK